MGCRLLPLAKADIRRGYEGFYHLIDLKGSVEKATLTYIIRDHDAEKFQAKKDYLKRVARWLNESYGEGTVAYEIVDSYSNMAPQIKPHWHLIETAYEAVREVGGNPHSILYEAVPMGRLSLGTFEEPWNRQHNHHPN